MTATRRRRRMASSGFPIGAGGVITASASSNIHTFDAAGNFTPAADGVVDVLIISGGGGGGDSQDRTGGGGGAGGWKYLASYPVVKGTNYPVVIGAAGAGGIAAGAAATNGGNSSFDGIASVGGGHGDGFSSGGAAVGGSGGGSRHGAGGAAGTAGQGFAGGTPGGNWPAGDANANFLASGGGGSAEAGKPAVLAGNGAAGAGGAGLPFYIRDILENWAAGGGGGEAWYGSAAPAGVGGAGGVGGGGAGASANGGVGVAGSAATLPGSGGGGGGRAGGNGGAGFLGRVVVAYRKAAPFLYDSFNRTDNPVTPGPAESGQAIVVTQGVGIITANTLGCSVPANMYWDFGTKDFRLQFKIALLPAGKTVYFQVRSDIGEIQEIYGYMDASGMDIREYDSGAGTDVERAVSLVPVLAGDIIEVIAKGLNFKVLQNGVLRLDANMLGMSGGTLSGISLDVGATVDWVKAWKN